MKLPALQFYPGDWHKDQGVQALDLEQRGAWFELLLMMHDSDERGVLLVNGKPMPEAVIARRLGLLEQNAKQILSKLLEYGVASIRNEDGAIFSRRMVKDEYIRQIRATAGAKGGKQVFAIAKPEAKPQAKAKQKDKQNRPPSSSSSSSIKIDRGTANADPSAPQHSAIENPVVGKKKGAAARPTLAELLAHAAEKYPDVPEAREEAPKFFNHYESNGWKVGKNPMVSWPASFSQWIARRGEFAPAGTAAPAPTRAKSAPKPTNPKSWS